VFRVLWLLVTLLFAASCSAGGNGNTIEMIPGRSFLPRSITIQKGQTVTWTVDADDAHTVTAYEDEIPEGADYFASGRFSSEEAARDNLGDSLLNEGDTYSVTFETPGTYEYFCIPHESDGMTGTIVVEP
jgi:plastocyanin